jgi:hypothetical protein
MASLQGGTTLWSAATLGNGSGDTVVSANANIGPGPWVCVYIKNTSAVALTFKVEVAGVAHPYAGRNALDDTADGGLDWYNYIPAGETSILSIAVAATSKVAIDLSPFSPELMRLVRTDTNGSAVTVSAFVTSFGAN